VQKAKPKIGKTKTGRLNGGEEKWEEARKYEKMTLRSAKPSG